MEVSFQSVSDVVRAYNDGLIDKEEARRWLGFREEQVGGAGVDGPSELAEAQRVIRVISGWNPDRVSTAEAIQPAIDYLEAHGT